MDVSDILEPLNEAQREAVSAPPGPTLVLAGAGSGKTRVLIHRIAWLIRVHNISPREILAVTFTNKAAGEMKHRVEEVIGIPVRHLWLGTFHGLAHRLLRLHFQAAGLPENFQILDADDQLRIVMRILKTLEIDEKLHQPKQFVWYINARKDEGLRASQVNDRGDYGAREMRRVYAAYEELCARSGLVDFAELLLRAHELLQKNPDLLAHYQQRFQHVMVDEFQDTNAIQYAWLRLLSAKHKNLFIVGDDDQSIYGWRGACVDNIRRFDQDFPGTCVVRLEQNYRSTSTILQAANALIAQNNDRLGKNLWTNGAEGEPINIYGAFNEIDEARFVVGQIKAWARDGNSRREAAILYRSNAQSRQFEEALIAASVPYRVYGGLRFFERAEIKDALAYLRLTQHRDDDTSLERVINTPTRGIGERSIDQIRQQARQQSVSLWQAMKQLGTVPGALTSRSAQALNNFVVLIDKMAADCAAMPLDEQVQHVIQTSGLINFFQQEKGEQGLSRVENLQELVSAAKQFVSDGDLNVDPDAPPSSPLTEFLSHAALESGVRDNGDEDCVQLMTLHSAKGLEFDLVFIGGLERGLFPHQMSMDDPDKLEEERRLCYVGITRARKRLYLSYAESRRIRGMEMHSRPSPFLEEIPAHLLREVRPQLHVTLPVSVSRPTSGSKTPSDDLAGYYVGQRVMHQQFGEGIILGHEGRGPHARVQINFGKKGAKWLVLSYANLQGL